MNEEFLERLYEECDNIYAEIEEGRIKIYFPNDVYFIEVIGKYERKKVCPLCDGKDSKGTTIWGNTVVCPACKGKGTVTK